MLTLTVVIMSDDVDNAMPALALLTTNVLDLALMGEAKHSKETPSLL
jgi:hypothetical protein